MGLSARDFGAFHDFVTGNWARPRGHGASQWLRERLWRSTIFVMLLHIKDVNAERTALKLENRELRAALKRLESTTEVSE